MEYKIKFYKKPPKGMSVVENENGYTININSVNWEIFPLWVFMVGILMPFIIGAIMGYFGCLFFVAFFLYFIYPMSFTVFMRAKIIVEGSFFKVYFFDRNLFGLKPYAVDLMDIHRIRMPGAVRASSNYNRSGMSRGGVIEITSFDRDGIFPISVYIKEYNIFILQFLKEYIKVLNIESGERRIVRDDAGGNGLVLEKL